MSTAVSTGHSQAIVRKVYQAFFSPARYEVKITDEAILRLGTTSRVAFAGGELALTTWGEGPTILLMHGWGGARAQMTGFVEPLLAAGYRVAAYDQPGHGESDGEMTNLLEIAPSLELVSRLEGPFHAVIAHSFGTLVTSYAIVNGLLASPARLVYFGAFNRLMDSLPRFQAIAQLPDEIIDGLRAMIWEKFGQNILESITNESMAPQIDVPALMFHDTADSVTPVEDSRAVARAWKHGRLLETSGLGHRGALQSKEIHEQVIRFLKDPQGVI